METFFKDAKGYNICRIQTISLKPNFHKIMAGFFPFIHKLINKPRIIFLSFIISSINFG